MRLLGRLSLQNSVLKIILLRKNAAVDICTQYKYTKIAFLLEI